ncbi:MAG TPA: class I SAM-dependent methyltransferase [Xanthobacteraceae bacterium]|nr:class I SAM-dependent methyltransferase [Xanthobacteraceae bacterium]
MPKNLRPVKGMNMEGVIARWYARNTVANRHAFRAEAVRYAARLPDGASVLEIAPGPGYLAIELAKLGNFRIAGIDYSHTFVDICRANAKAAGAAAEFRQGDAAHLPFEDGSFDFVVCRAAFKNFGDPVGALNEMHRVLRPAGAAVIVDMRKDASNRAIAQEVATMNQGWFNAMMTRGALRSLRGRAYSRADFERMIAQTPFGADIREDGIGFEITLTKPGSA